MGYGLVAMKVLVLSSMVLSVVVASGVELPVQRRRVPAMYVFGDSTLDVGNNNHLEGEQVPRANKPYYGIDLPGSGKPTGRFSNGYNVADFVGNIHSLSESRLLMTTIKYTMHIYYQSKTLAGYIDDDYIVL